METTEIKKLEHLKQLIARHHNINNKANNQKEVYTTQIKLLNYYELGCIITEMLKLCILALDQETYKLSEMRNTPSVNVSVILETVIQMFPLDELELLSEITEMMNSDS
ncbi:hypothetical protein [Flavobacterium sp. C3NV]|uniref:hypothetical protein n=1 Tax=Flavobacterium sp. C3NV TaxID=3393358 RepID=UPI00399016ED